MFHARKSKTNKQKDTTKLSKREILSNKLGSSFLKKLFLSICYGSNVCHLLPRSYSETQMPSITLFGDRAFTEVTEVKRSCRIAL